MQGVDDFNATEQQWCISTLRQMKTAYRKNHQRCESVAAKHFDLMSRQISDESIKFKRQPNQHRLFVIVLRRACHFVAALVIANTFQVLVAQRRRTLMLHHRQEGQLYGSVLFRSGGARLRRIRAWRGAWGKPAHVRACASATGRRVCSSTSPGKPPSYRSLRHCGDGACIHGIARSATAVTPLRHCVD